MASTGWYTDDRPFNPKIHFGRGELWLDFKADDAQVASGGLNLIEVHQGHWQASQWRSTDGSMHPEVRTKFLAAKYWLTVDRDA